MTFAWLGIFIRCWKKSTHKRRSCRENSSATLKLSDKLNLLLIARREEIALDSTKNRRNLFILIRANNLSWAEISMCDIFQFFWRLQKISSFFLIQTSDFFEFSFISLIKPPKESAQSCDIYIGKRLRWSKKSAYLSALKAYNLKTWWRLMLNPQHCVIPFPLCMWTRKSVDLCVSARIQKNVRDRILI